MRKTFEYKIFDANPYATQDLINCYGLEGWELVAVIGKYYGDDMAPVYARMYFKREIIHE